jgi:hypothetical protein
VHGGVSAALTLIAGCMAVVALSVGLLGPRTRGKSLELLSEDDGTPDIRDRAQDSAGLSTFSRRATSDGVKHESNDAIAATAAKRGYRHCARRL